MSGFIFQARMLFQNCCFLHRIQIRIQNNDAVECDFDAAAIGDNLFGVPFSGRFYSGFQISTPE
jgi:hypothetical protein